LAPFFSKRRAGGNPFRQPDAGGGIIFGVVAAEASLLLSCLSIVKNQGKLFKKFLRSFPQFYRNYCNFTATIIDCRRKYLRLQNAPFEKSLKKYAR